MFMCIHGTTLNLIYCICVFVIILFLNLGAPTRGSVTFIKPGINVTKNVYEESEIRF